MRLSALMTKIVRYMTLLFVISSVTGYSIPAFAAAHQKSKVAIQKNKTHPAIDLKLDLSEKWKDPEAGIQAVNNKNQYTGNEIQKSSLNRSPVKVNCNMDIIQNTLNDVPLSSRLFGECGLNYHY